MYLASGFQNKNTELFQSIAALNITHKKTGISRTYMTTKSLVCRLDLPMTALSLYFFLGLFSVFFVVVFSRYLAGQLNVVSMVRVNRSAAVISPFALRSQLCFNLTAEDTLVQFHAPSCQNGFKWHSTCFICRLPITRTEAQARERAACGGEDPSRHQEGAGIC